MKISRWFKFISHFGDIYLQVRDTPPILDWDPYLLTSRITSEGSDFTVTYTLQASVRWMSQSQSQAASLSGL